MIAAAEPAPQAPPAPMYAGLVTRTIAFALDIAIVDVTALTVGAIVGLCLSALELSSTFKTVLVAAGAVLFVIWTVGYFAWFWSVAGQTPGDRVLGLKVIEAETGRPPGLPRSILRVGAVLLSGILLCIGFLMILFDSRRRALHDRLVGTVVTYVPSGRSSASGDVVVLKTP